MDSDTKKTLAVLAVIVLVILGYVQYEDYREEKKLEEQRRIEAQKQYQTCPQCMGDKVVYNAYYGINVLCPTCNGSGQIEVKKRWGGSFGSRNNEYDCDRCLCKKYERKSTFNSDCKNCGHLQGYHYSQK